MIRSIGELSFGIRRIGMRSIDDRSGMSVDDDELLR
jgi:hypothetical protein